MLFSSYLKEVLKKMPSALVVVNAIGAVLHLNGAAEKALDISASQAKGHRFADLFFAGVESEGQGHYFHPLLETLATGKEYTDALSWLMLNNKIRHYFYTTRRLYHWDGRARGAFIIFQDITEVTQRQEVTMPRGTRHQVALHLLERQSEYILANINTGVLGWDKSGIITMLNKNGKSILSIDAQEAIGQPVSLVLKHIDCFNNALIQALNMQQPLIAEEAEITVRGQEKHLLVNGQQFVDEESGLINYVVLFQDISELKRSQEITRRQDKLASIGQLAAGMAHEIRNPLTSIKGFVQLLNRNSAQDLSKKSQEYLAIIAEEINRTDKIISDFLLFAKPRRPERRLCHINQLLVSAADLTENTCLMRGIAMKRDLQPNLPPVFIDQDQITQVLINLLSNAVDATEGCPNPVIFVSCGTTPGWIWINVKDTGIGMSAENLRKVCTPFFSTKDHGTGLGLSIAYNIVREHGGTLDFESQEGTGTTVTLKLPVITLETGALLQG
ncbi:MAG: PAS domain-containing protein [Syntrophomonadaceae bacterium]|nr:PAS domain-containing protein [Syntrophomonadaceae bacterium]